MRRLNAVLLTAAACGAILSIATVVAVLHPGRGRHRIPVERSVGRLSDNSWRDKAAPR